MACRRIRKWTPTFGCVIVTSTPPAPKGTGPTAPFGGPFLLLRLVPRRSPHAGGSRITSVVAPYLRRSGLTSGSARAPGPVSRATDDPKRRCRGSALGQVVIATSVEDDALPVAAFGADVADFRAQDRTPCERYRARASPQQDRLPARSACPLLCGQRHGGWSSRQPPLTSACPPGRHRSASGAPPGHDFRRCVRRHGRGPAVSTHHPGRTPGPRQWTRC